MRRRPAIQLLLALATTALLPGTFAQGAGAAPKRQPDPGDVAEGRSVGEVASDSKGSSQEGVTPTVSRTGLNRVSIAGDDMRLLLVEVTLMRLLDKIVQARDNTVIFYDWAKRPAKLDVSFCDPVSWSGAQP